MKSLESSDNEKLFIASNKEKQPEVDELQKIITKLIKLKKIVKTPKGIESIDKEIVALNKRQYELCYAKIHDSATNNGKRKRRKRNLKV